ncbi:MAG: hypothetical protein KF802_12620 [Bdellovibrionaceae bacterium]|nr:hypothetical protein [Pseudobdellovibrionaceae bacterium]MBX3034816.1 hypothetical protein [Pseudobdellovibrionaceae bacterium]
MKKTTPLIQWHKTLRSEGDVEIPMDPAYYEALHDRIMSAVAKTEMKPEPWYARPGRLLRAPWRSWFVPAPSSAPSSRS